MCPCFTAFCNSTTQCKEMSAQINLFARDLHACQGTWSEQGRGRLCCLKFCVVYQSFKRTPTYFLKQFTTCSFYILPISIRSTYSASSNSTLRNIWVIRQHRYRSVHWVKHRGLLTLSVWVLSNVNSAAVDVIDLSFRSTNKTLELNTSTSTERGELMALDRGSITHYNYNSYLHHAHRTSYPLGLAELTASIRKHPAALRAC